MFVKTLFETIKFPTATVTKVGVFTTVKEAALAAKVLVLGDGTVTGLTATPAGVELTVTEWK